MILYEPILESLKAKISYFGTAHICLTMLVPLEAKLILYRQRPLN